MEIITVIAILLSPLIAVLVTIWMQNRKEKRERKEAIFSTLMAHRRAFPPVPDWVKALNLIDVVFSENQKVVVLWHQYYQLLGSASSNNEYQDREHKYIELLSEMAKVLGYKNLQQTDIDKYYSPQVIEDQNKLNFETQTEWLRVLKETQNLSFIPKDK